MRLTHPKPLTLSAAALVAVALTGGPTACSYNATMQQQKPVQNQPMQNEEDSKKKDRDEDGVG